MASAATRSAWPSAGVRQASTRRPWWFSIKPWPMKQSLASLPVGKCHRHNLERFAGEKLREPGILLRLLSRELQHRMGSDHQNASQISIALFRDRPELLLAAGRILPWHSPDPGRQIATRPECLWVRDRGRNGGRAHQTNPRDAPQPLACFVQAMMSNNPLLD